MNKVLISVLGHDQPGIIAAVSAVICSRQGNIENVSQTLLQSMFGALMIVAVPASETPQGLRHAFDKVCRDLQLTVHVDSYQVPPLTVKPAVQPYIVTAIGPDQRGLVCEVAKVLALHQVNITNMQAIFKGGTKPLDNLMIFEVDIPRHTVMDALREGLHEISARLGLDVKLRHRKIFESVSRIQN